MPDGHFQLPDTVAMEIDACATFISEQQEQEHEQGQKQEQERQHHHHELVPQSPRQPLSSASATDLLRNLLTPKSRNVDLPPEIILEILSLCAWEDQDVFRHVSSLWYSYILKSLRRTRFSYPKPRPLQTAASIRKNRCGTHRLLKSLTLSYSWTKPTEELRLDRRSDGVWWKEGEVTEDWLAKTFFWTESCTDPPMKGVKIRLKGCYWNGQEGDLVLHMTCFAGNGQAVSVQDVCSRIKRLFTASPYRNVLVYGVELQMGEDGVPFFSGKAVLTKKP